MSHSDDFGLDDDDTEFFLAATQAEASRPAGFAPSPRPNKRRRLSQGPSDLDGADEHEADHPNVDEEYYFPGELEPVTAEEQRKTSRFKIHIPEHGCEFQRMVFTQTQHGLDENPAAFRGAIWKKPPKPLPPTFPQKTGDRSSKMPPMSKGPVRNGIGNYFQTVPGRAPAFSQEDDDAALAARLQAEEDLLARQHNSNARNASQAMFDPTQELADLPEDAFSSSSPERSPRKDGPINISSQPTQSQSARPPSQALRGPQTGLKQMTMWGHAATQELTSSQSAQKRHAWPLANRDEKPTHHKLDEKAMTTWIYPTNLGSIREYQFNIVSRSLFHNTLVALPTGLGKTFIAATIMLNYYRWTTDAQIVFMAPTKPLIAQQMEACYGIVGIPRRDTVLMTGESAPAIRGDKWTEKRVFFMTPQTVINDLRSGVCDPKRIVLLVVDEAHKATGGYAYTEVVQFLRRFNSSFRVLALTATPGSTTEAVQAVVDNLGIARVELRTETSLDIRQYTHEKQTETQVFEFSEEQERIMTLFAKALRPSVEKLCSQNAYYNKDPLALTAYGLTQARQKWMASEAGRKAPQGIKGMVNALFTVLSSLAHSISLLKYHGIGPFYGGVRAFQRDVESGAQKGKTAAGIANDENFIKMMSTVRTWTNDPEFIGHPKLDYLRQVVLAHFLDAGEGRQGSDVPPSATRVMIFASYRDSVDEIVRVLQRNSPMIRPSVFVGQQASKGGEGMNQKKQNETIQDFKNGKFNTLVATSIGEEGLDIGTVDLIVCYDASASPIRMLQRIGRTGRKRTGNVVLLLTKGKEENDYAKAQDNYAYIQKTIADASKYAYRDDQSPRILPKEFRPVPDKRPVEIPPENSQPVELNEKKGKGKGKTKRPPKKFHMPDNVRTGFVNASRLGSDGENDQLNTTAVKKKKTPATKKAAIPAVFKRIVITPEPEPAPLPHLQDIILTEEQQAELELKYAQSAEADNGVIRAPDYERFPGALRDLGPTKYIGHGREARRLEKSMRAAHDMNADVWQHWDTILHPSDLEDAGSAGERLVRPWVETVQSVPSLKRVQAPMRPPKAASTKDTPKSETVADDGLPDESMPPAKKPRGRPKKVIAPPPVLSASESELPAPPPCAKKPRGRPKKAASPIAVIPDDPDPGPEPDLPAKQTPAPKSRRAPKKNPGLQRAMSYGSAAGEGASSSPEPTPADMRIATQGIDLGEHDTSGEDEEEEPDSEDAAFIARSDEIDIASSSQPGAGTQAVIHPGGRLRKKPVRVHLSDVDERSEDASLLGLESGESDDDDGVVEVQPAVVKGRKRMVVDDSDDE
jgi:ATP-dependent DNA helicase MPH1